MTLDNDKYRKVCYVEITEKKKKPVGLCKKIRAGAAVVVRAEISKGFTENPQRNSQEEECRHQNDVT